MQKRIDFWRQRPLSTGLCLSVLGFVLGIAVIATQQKWIAFWRDQPVTIGLCLFVVGFFLGMVVVATLIASKSVPPGEGVEILQQWLWVAWAIVFTSALLTMVVFTWGKAPGVVKDVKVSTEGAGVGLVCAIGAIGGFLRWMHALETKRLAKLPDIVSVLWPLEGAGLALIVVLLLRAGLILPSSEPGTPISANWFGFYAVGGLVGLFAPDAIGKLSELFRGSFNRSQEGDTSITAKAARGAPGLQQDGEPPQVARAGSKAHDRTPPGDDHDAVRA